MAEAYVLINVRPGAEEKVQGDVKKTPGVQEVYVSYGVYDLVVKVASDSVDEMKELVTHRLRNIDGVVSTLTLIVVG
jgi:DNA-binding Lrp family transcriptional regulator